jgi:hypothetical protein
MAEFYLKLSDGKVITEHGDNIPWERCKLMRMLAGREILRIGIQKERGTHDRKGNVEILIPPDAKGILQCKLAEVRNMKVTTTLYIIGYVDAAGIYAAATADFTTGASLGTNINISGLDLSPHVIWKEI